MTYRHPQLVAMDRVARERRKMRTAAREVDVDAFVVLVKALPVFRDCPRSIAKTEVRVVHSAHVTGGYAHGSRLARIRISPNATVAWLLSAIVHELVHCALPDRTVHNERFRRTYGRALRELWALEVPEERLGGRPGAYAVDRWLEDELPPRLESGAITYPKLSATDPVERARLLAERHASMRQKKAAHAARMLAHWERRLKTAERLSAKWRRKVTYYNRPLKEGSS